jgi:signal transduction histidine kinase
MTTCAEAFEARRPFTMEFRLRDAGGAYRWVIDHGVPRFDAGGAFLGFVGSCVDVTRRNLAEADALQQRAALARVLRVAVLGELTAALAHELRQPLAAIMTNAQAAGRFLAAAPAPRDLAEAREALADIAADTRRAADVIDRLRHMLSPDAATAADATAAVAAAPLDLNAVIRTVGRLLNGEAVARRVEVRPELAPDLPPAAGDEVELQQVIMNLMMNAFDAMERTAAGSRRLVLRTCVVDGGNGGGGGHVRAEVRDNGVGIPAGELERIFEPFVTTKAGGLGMGLSICRSIVERHGGKLWAANNADGNGNGRDAGEGAGATVSLTLPVARAPAAAAAPGGG